MLTRFTTPEEIFGPLSLRALENDEYKRCTSGFLPTSSVAFLDEIFKANSAILNTLLTILNERQFDNGGGVREECPIKCVVAASNELPDSDELDALYDRFLLRKEVLSVSDDLVVDLLTMTSPGVSRCIDDSTDQRQEDNCDVVFVDELDKIIEEVSEASASVEMGPDIAAILRDLRIFMRDELDVNVSDRRLVKAAQLLKVSAACNGRKRVDALDALLLQHMTWRMPEQRALIREWLWDNLSTGGNNIESSIAQCCLLLDKLKQEAGLLIRKTAGDVSGKSGARELDVAAISNVRKEVKNLGRILTDQMEKIARHQYLLQEAKEHLWLEESLVRSAQQLWVPKIESTLSKVQEALNNAHALDLVLTSNDDQEGFPSDDIRLSVLEQLWEEEQSSEEVYFTDEELLMGMKEAKSKYDGDTFRGWKRARKKAKK